MGAPKGPCRDCDKRTVGCHAGCDIYKNYREQLEDWTEKRKKEKENVYYKRRRTSYNRVSHYLRLG